MKYVDTYLNRTNARYHMFTTWSTKGIDLNVRLVLLLKKTITAMTPAQGVLCIRDP
jgi:hypothetical protein